MPRKWSFAPAAAQDVRRLTQRSREEWGLAHSIEYAEALYAAFDRIAAHPSGGRARDDITLGLRSWPVRSYVVFYRILEREVKLARVLHHRQDPGRAFSEQPHT